MLEAGYIIEKWYCNIVVWEIWKMRIIEKSIKNWGCEYVRKKVSEIWGYMREEKKIIK